MKSVFSTISEDFIARYTNLWRLTIENESDVFYWRVDFDSTILALQIKRDSEFDHSILANFLTPAVDICLNSIHEGPDLLGFRVKLKHPLTVPWISSDQLFTALRVRLLALEDNELALGISSETKFCEELCCLSLHVIPSPEEEIVELQLKTSSANSGVPLQVFTEFLSDMLTSNLAYEDKYSEAISNFITGIERLLNNFGCPPKLVS
ncbi:MAG: hypothetical protein N2654_02985, partial [Deltaproteobacteria bacterium]|nr:hypothetical protein [Deltaproteobacteria bacterium]